MKLRSLPPRRKQHGGAMMMTLIVVAALLGGAAVLVSLQLGSNKATDVTRSGLTALYCAEAGLSAARPYVAANYAQWNSSGGMCTATDQSTCGATSWLSTMIGIHDLDGDSAADFIVYLRDNNDEKSPVPNDLATDDDQKVFIVSKCIKFADNYKQIQELVEFNGATPCTPSQQGGCNGNGNDNAN